MDEQQQAVFRETVWDYYAHHSRDLPWRQPTNAAGYDPYAIMVSELMLQQTQVTRVIQKFEQFMRQFPTVAKLAASSLGDVLTAWSGLGYNRRAKFLHAAAQQIISHYNGVFPDTLATLTALPGIGTNTAGAILAYAFNLPVVFIETNIRTVYIHHFFADQQQVTDKQLAEVVAATIDHDQPREWYWALMDYGSHLKQTVGNLSRLSTSYARQSTFHGSRRQIRGAVIRQLTTGPVSLHDLQVMLSDDRLPVILQELAAEGLIHEANGSYKLGAA